MHFPETSGGPGSSLFTKLVLKIKKPWHTSRRRAKNKKRKAAKLHKEPTVALRAASTGQPQYFENVTLSGLTECSSTACWSSDNVE